MIRIVGLSATLPNYRDVGRFLGVNRDSGGWAACLSVLLLWMQAGDGFPAVSCGNHPWRPPGPASPPLAPPPPPAAGLFYFDASYRPVPLEMQFVGVSERNVMARMNIQDEICYQKVGHQVQSCV